MTTLSSVLQLGSFLSLCLVVPTFADSNDWTDRAYQAFGLADKGHDLTTESKVDGTRIIRTTGSDPYLGSVGLAEKIETSQDLSANGTHLESQT